MNDSHPASDSSTANCGGNFQARGGGRAVVAGVLPGRIKVRASALRICNRRHGRRLRKRPMVGEPSADLSGLGGFSTMKPGRRSFTSLAGLSSAGRGFTRSRSSGPRGPSALPDSFRPRPGGSSQPPGEFAITRVHRRLREFDASPSILFHKPRGSGLGSAPSGCGEKLEPTHVGCYGPEGQRADVD